MFVINALVELDNFEIHRFKDFMKKSAEIGRVTMKYPYPKPDNLWVTKVDPKNDLSHA